MRPPLCFMLPLLAALLASPTFAAATSIDLSVDVSRPAANDLTRATVFAEASGGTPGELAKRVNSLIGDGLKTARTYASVKIQSGGTQTYPVYAKGGKVDAWRMRSDLILESTDSGALSELLGKLQTSLAVAGVAMLPAAETRKKAENEAILDAIASFKLRARLIADALGKPYRIKQLTINSSGRPPAMPMMRAVQGFSAGDAAAMPIEAGETQISSNVSGQIELVE